MTKAMKIMAAVDLSEYSATIVRYCGWLAMRLEAELVLVNVINQRDLDMVGRDHGRLRGLFLSELPDRAGGVS